MRLMGMVLAGVLGVVAISAAEVNCKQVNKYLATGRSVSDVAETMVISESDVKACQEAAAEGGAKPAGDAAAKDGAAPK